MAKQELSPAEKAAEIARLSKAADSEVANVERVTAFTEDQLSDVKTVDDAFRVLESAGMSTASIDDFGSGFTLVEDKQALVGAEMLLLQWRFNGGDFGDFVSVTAVTRDGRRVIFNDGSTGIMAQLAGVTRKRDKAGEVNPQAGLLCPRGLRKSEYTYTDDKGQSRPAQTFYLA